MWRAGAHREAPSPRVGAPRGAPGLLLVSQLVRRVDAWKSAADDDDVSMGGKGTTFVGCVLPRRGVPYPCGWTRGNPWIDSADRRPPGSDGSRRWTFSSSLADAEIAVVDFYAGWCGPCIMFKPIRPNLQRLPRKVLHGERREAPAARKTVQIVISGTSVSTGMENSSANMSRDAFRETLESHFGKGDE